MSFLTKRKSKDKFNLEFKEGQIYKMNVSTRSHVKAPYYVEIIETTSNFIVTNIPNMHSLKIEKGINWDYHIPRMEYIGEKETHGHLILNQKNLI